MKNVVIGLLVVIVAILAVLLGIEYKRHPEDFRLLRPDELLPGPQPVATDSAGGRSTAELPQTAANVFKEMDGGIELTEDEIKGRNTWILWTAGSEQLWDHLAGHSYGIVDLLKTLDSRKRPSRFKELGLINEPGMKPAARPDQYGLWLDERDGPEPEGIDPKVYGRSSGVFGLRIYTNPAFDEQARKNWDPQKYYSDPSYYNDAKLVRPYRVGMTCGLCHVAPHPLYPPDDPEAPQYKNLASAIGNQYFREGLVFAYNLKPGSFLWEIINSQPAGTSDTSRIATDHINNPGAMNAIFSLDARLSAAHEEHLSGGALNLPGGDHRLVPHILKDGADSCGVPSATIRVFINIGLFHQQWFQCHNPLVGLFPQKPFEIWKAQQNSVYWRATEERLDNIANFFKKIKPMRLEDAPGGKEFLTKDDAVMKRGKLMFAENCARCHSSKQPPADVTGAAAREWFRKEVEKPDFLDNNFLSDEVRYPVTEIRTNAARALGTNAMRGHVWDNFSSETYKTLPSVGEIQTYNPADPGTPFRFTAPEGGPGYYRPPSLISIWATAPFFHNNCLGEPSSDPSVKGRMKAFNDAAEKLLWPEKRLGPKSIWKTTQESFLEIPLTVLPKELHALCEKDVLKIGPIPAGTPINLLANLEPKLEDWVRLIPEAKAWWLAQKLNPDSDATKQLTKKMVGDLLKASKCPDLIEDRGHEYGKELPDADKRALIEYLKTL